MSASFDPYVPFDPANPTALSIEGDVRVTAVTDHPAIGTSNLVVNPNEHFHIRVEWEVVGNASPIWLAALSSSRWDVTAYVESMGPGDEKFAAKSPPIAVGDPSGLTHNYSADLVVPAGTLKESNPGDPTQSGLYKIVVTVFLNSPHGLPGYDMMGYAEGPIVLAEDPN